MAISSCPLGIVLDLAWILSVTMALWQVWVMRGHHGHQGALVGMGGHTIHAKRKAGVLNPI